MNAAYPWNLIGVSGSLVTARRSPQFIGEQLIQHLNRVPA